MFRWFKSKPKEDESSQVFSLEPVSITNLVDKITKSDSNVWLDITTDIEATIFKTREQKPEFMMPMLYAYRTAMAGRFTIGEFPKEDYDLACSLFTTMGKQISALFMVKGRNDQAQIDFQEKSGKIALEFINSYGVQHDDMTVKLLVATANNGIRVIDGLFNSLMNELGSDKELVCETICRTHVTPEFCIKLFKQSNWNPFETNQELVSQKVGSFYRGGLLLADRYAVSPEKTPNKYEGSSQISKLLIGAVNRYGKGDGHLWQELLYDVQTSLAENEDEMPLSILIAVYCTQKAAAAGLFLEGKITKERYIESSNQLDIVCEEITALAERGSMPQGLYHTIMSESLSYCAELIYSYGFNATAEGVRDMVAMADRDISLVNMIEWFFRQTNPSFDKEAAVTPKFTLDFFNTQEWRAHEDSMTVTIAKVGAFYTLTKQKKKLV